MPELKECPFCGKKDADVDEYGVHCNCCDANIDTVDEWNTRPIEGKLNNKISTLETQIESLRKSHEDVIHRFADAKTEYCNRMSWLDGLKYELSEKERQVADKDKEIERLRESIKDYVDALYTKDQCTCPTEEEFYKRCEDCEDKLEHMKALAQTAQKGKDK